MRLVVDTNVMVAALRSDQGASRQLLLAALRGQYTLLVSVPLMVEYEAVLTRTEHLSASGASAEEVNEILDLLSSRLEPVNLAFLWRPMLRDTGDEMVLETVVNGGADALVTLNVRHFEGAARLFRFAVVSPGSALMMIRRANEKK